jgi:hypothetical protein
MRKRISEIGSVLSKALDYHSILSKGNENRWAYMVFRFTPKIFAWIGYLSAVGALKILNEKVDSSLVSVIFYGAQVLFILYTFVCIFTPLGYLAKEWNLKMQKQLMVWPTRMELISSLVALFVVIFLVGIFLIAFNILLREIIVIVNSV